MGGLGCDNMTVVLVCFLNGESYEKLGERCKLAPLPLSQVGNLNNNILNSSININNNNTSNLNFFNYFLLRRNERGLFL